MDRRAGRQIVDQHVAGVDFHNVMQQCHLDHALNVYVSTGVGRQAHGGDGEVPTVFGGVFLALGAQHFGAALHAFQLIDFHQELDDLGHCAEI